MISSIQAMTNTRMETYRNGEERHLACGLFADSLLALRSYQDQLEVSQSHLDSLISSTTSTLDLLASLSKSFQAVEAQTTAFQQQCEGLLSEQKRLTEMADGIGRNLKYYSYLEPITRRLNAPGAGNFVRGKEFSDMLARLDQCLEYTAAHVRPINLLHNNVC